MEDILRRYPIGAVSDVRKASSGLMHGTWLVTAERGRFVLQRLHHKLATPEILSDFRAVTEHLAARGMLAPQLVDPLPEFGTGRGVAEVDGRWWRLATFVEGETHDAVSSPAQAEEGARVLAHFHRVMDDIPYHFQSQHPLHDTEGHLRRLREAVAKPEHAEALATVAEEIAEVDRQLSAMLLPPDLPRRVVHGDPKISNVLFQGDRAVALLDLDTCTRHTPLVDLGDAVRSWCRDGNEDERQKFLIDRFEAILRGYAAEGPALTAAERAMLGHAGRLITLELASRFLRDVLEDEYFAWDDRRFPDRRTHNRARGRAMLHLANDMASWQGEIDALVRKWFP